MQLRCKAWISSSICRPTVFIEPLILSRSVGRFFLLSSLMNKAEEQQPRALTWSLRDALEKKFKKWNRDGMLQRYVSTNILQPFTTILFKQLKSSSAAMLSPVLPWFTDRWRIIEPPQQFGSRQEDLCGPRSSRYVTGCCSEFQLRNQYRWRCFMSRKEAIWATVTDSISRGFQRKMILSVNFDIGN